MQLQLAFGELTAPVGAIYRDSLLFERAVAGVPGKQGEQCSANSEARSFGGVPVAGVGVGVDSVVPEGPVRQDRRPGSAGHISYGR